MKKLKGIALTLLGLAVAGGFILLLSAAAYGQSLVGGPKVGTVVGVQFVCDTAKDIKYIFTGRSDEQAVVRYQEKLKTEKCALLPYPIPGKIQEVVSSFIDHSGDRIIIVRIQEDLYTFTVEKTTGA